MLIYSFLTKEFRGGVIWEFSLASYDQFFVDRGLFGDETPKIEWTYINIYIRSLVQATFATFFCLLIGFPTAYFIATRPASTRSVWLYLITIPYWVNLLIRTVSMKFLIRDTGPLNQALMNFGVIDAPIHLINTNVAVQLGLFYSYLPFMVLPIYASVERYNTALSEAGADPDLLGGAKTFMIGSLIEEQFKGSASNWPFGAAASMILLSIILVVLVKYAKSQAREQV